MPRFKAVLLQISVFVLFAVAFAAQWACLSRSQSFGSGAYNPAGHAYPLQAEGTAPPAPPIPLPGSGNLVS